MNVVEKIYIVGAHSRAQTLGVYLHYLYPGLLIEAYLYDNEESNPEKIGEIPVIQLEKDTKELHTEYPIFIGTRGIYHEKLIHDLKEQGFEKIYPVTVELDLYLRNAYLKKYYASIDRDFAKIDDFKEKQHIQQNKLQHIQQHKILDGIQSRIYVVKSAADKPLQQDYRLEPYEAEILAGAALAGRKNLSPGILTDDTGDNISVRNKQYSELTALYWIWKHAEEDIIGLAHYRRHFILPPDWQEIMQDCDIDVILPVPLYVLPNIAENYRSRHDSDDWDFLMQYLKEESVSLYEDAQKFFKGNLYSPCNMFIMKREILDEFCRWMFPVLDAVTLHGGEKEDSYLNRYPGFIAERLLTFFFEKNRDVYKVIYADKNFLG